MRRATASAPLDHIERQIRRVRRRWNARELQRAVFSTGALAGVALSLVLLLALRAGPRLFTAVAWGIAALFPLGAALVLRAGLRRRIAARGAPAWIDRRSGLRGALTTLVELRDREAAFAPLLLEQNVRRRNAWRPRALVPRLVPLGALAALGAGLALLGAIIALAPRLRPRTPELVYAERAGDDWPRGMDGIDQGAERLLVAPAPGSEGTPDAGDRAQGGIPTSDSTLARLASSLQEQIRDRLLGKDTEGAAAANGDRSANADRPAPHGSGRDAPGRDADGEGDAPRAPDAAQTGKAREGNGRGDGARGAGSHTDPELYGIATPLPHTSDAAFRLAIAARVRAEHTGPRPPEGEAPPAAADVRPALGDRQRSEAGIHRMPLPAAYAPLVRELFSRREP